MRDEIIVYQPNELLRLDVRLENETVWLTQTQLCALFGVVKSNISYHLRNIFATKELDYAATVQKIRTVQIESGRNVARDIEYYNLDVIISLGYRINSKLGIQFRQWATKVLKEYLLRGYAVNDRIESLERRVAKHDEQIGYFIKASLPPMEGVLFEGQICDGYNVAMKIIKSAKNAIVLIDNYVDETVLAMLAERKQGVSALILTRKISAALKHAIECNNAQYAPIEVLQYSGSHDRFIIIDGSTVYHIGASLKDLGKKLFAFSRLDIDARYFLSKFRREGE